MMQTVLRAAEKAAASTIPALIEGESGVGKELIARAIHGSGERRAKPFIAVNCGALPENLVESILFGHEKGAFTGATEKHSGKFAEADGGTLFLDEVGELPLTAQVKLLRALQQGEIEPVGGRKSVKVDVRIVSATNRDLIADVKAGRFREDLFYRLHVFPITVPPLRARPEDIAELARHFLARFAAEEGKRVNTIGADALALMYGYTWPGNVRQLENAIFRAVVLAEAETLGVNEFPQLRSHDENGAALPAILGVPMLREEMPMAPRSFGELTTPQTSLPLTDAQDQVRTLDEIERDVIRFAISHYRGQMSEVARRLQIGRSTLYRKLESLGFEQPAVEHADVN
jgi:DNA-binding NtrC family response regulator